MDSLSLTDALTLDPEVRFRRVFDEAVMIHPDHSEALLLNDTAAAFLELCDGQRSFEQIIELLGDQYEVSETTLHQDMRTFVGELHGLGLVTSNPAVQP